MHPSSFIVVCAALIVALPAPAAAPSSTPAATAPATPKHPPRRAAGGEVINDGTDAAGNARQHRLYTFQESGAAWTLRFDAVEERFEGTGEPEPEDGGPVTQVTATLLRGKAVVARYSTERCSQMRLRDGISIDDVDADGTVEVYFFFTVSCTQDVVDGFHAVAFEGKDVRTANVDVYDAYFKRRPVPVLTPDADPIVTRLVELAWKS